MPDYFHDPNESKTEPLDIILEHILHISSGKCLVTEQMILEAEDHQQQLIFSGLKMLHDDLEEYKKDFAQKLEAEHQLEILKNKNEELIQFNYVASHDLQEPLRTITSLSQILNNNYAKNLDEQGQTFLEIILQSSKRMSELIADLLKYSKVGQSIEFVRVPTREIVDNVLLDLGGVLSQAQPVFCIGDLPVITCNRIAMKQVFQNIIGNGLKFKKEGKPVHLTISCKSTQDTHTFCIKDNGIGIDPIFQEKIFGIFQRLHNKDKYEGTGIGLALCVKVMDMHQGKIWVESEGEGSEFYFTIPNL